MRVLVKSYLIFVKCSRRRKMMPGPSQPARIACVSRSARGKCRNIAVDRRVDGIARRHGKTAAGKKIVLHIDRDQRITG